MILILAHHYDKEAVWLANRLGEILPEGFPEGNPGGPPGSAVGRPAGRIPEHPMDAQPERPPGWSPGRSADTPQKPGVFLLVPEALGVDYDITLRLSDREILATLQPLQGGPEFSSPEVTFLLNRLSYVDPLVWKKAGETDRAYATGEINAFFAAFIHAFTCPVVNPVVHGALPESSSRNFSLLMALRKQGVAIHPALFQEDGEAFQTMISHLNGCTRMMTFGENILAAPRDKSFGQEIPINPATDSPEMLKKNLRDALRDTAHMDRPGHFTAQTGADSISAPSGSGTLKAISNPRETPGESTENRITFNSQEFFFREAEGKSELIFISRTPAYSLYAEEFLPLLLRIIKNTSP